jgi:tRNA (guanine-N7-)-methyltransferase
VLALCAQSRRSYNAPVRCVLTRAVAESKVKSTMRANLHDYANIALRLEDIEGTLEFPRVFGREAPIHVEVGSGKGTFLVHEAAAHPEMDFVGIEWANKYYRYAVDRIGRHGLPNVRLIRTEAAGFLRDFVRQDTVDCFHIYFPDPWPKKRHHKRRLLRDEIAAVLIERLKSGGELRIATDHQDYFTQMREVLGAYRTKLEEIAFVSPAGAAEGERTGTNYERKYVQENRPIYTVALRKRSALTTESGPGATERSAETR